ncbi:ATP-binding cassette domain-containing protein [Cellulophaga fucicola]|uniref:ATP-binding cassette domain-containing protein n=1 Tax=Cellulophaga fucicola TaxID=76595 RepID=UPI003EBB612B
MIKHITIFTTNESNTSSFITSLLKDEKPEEFNFLKGIYTALFSKSEVLKFIKEEEIHDIKTLTANTMQSLKSMSSGEQKRVLLKYLLDQKPKYIILDNPFDNLDTAYQTKLKELLLEISESIGIILICNRQEDRLPIVSKIYKLKKDYLKHYSSLTEYNTSINNQTSLERLEIPKNNTAINYAYTELIRFKDVSVSFQTKKVLHQINWQINKGEFWQLIGENGSGKTTLLSMITGENNKGYGQELYLFGQKKGSGESIWDIKKKIGYFTPSLTDNFKGNHTIEHMVLAGFTDAIGLYTKPTETQLNLTNQWLKIAGLSEIKNKLFNQITRGEQRLVMLLRAMVKQPLLLILDEPTAGLDDNNAALFVALVNKIANSKQTALIFVSHRKESNLEPLAIIELQTTPNGSIANILK